MPTIDPTMSMFNASSGNAAVKGLADFQSSIPGYFDTSGITNATNNLNTNILNTGAQAANSAGRQYSQMNMAQGGDASLGGVAAAQSLMPAYSQVSSNVSDLNKQKLQASEAQGTLAGNVASSLADLKTKYLQSLMGYTGTLQGQQQTAKTQASQLAQQGSEFQTTAQLQRMGLGIQQQQANTQTAAQQAQQHIAALGLLGQLPGTTAPTTVSGSGYSYTLPGSNPYANNPNLNALRNSVYGLLG